MREKLLKDRAALIKAMEDLMGKADTENRALSAEEQATFDASETKVKDIDATIERIDKMPKPASHGLELIPGGQVHNREEDRPWATFGEFLLGVRASQAPGGAVDPRLRAMPASEDGFAVPRVQRATPKALSGETVQQYLGRVSEMRAASGLNETVLSQGGFLVQQDMGTELIREMYDESLVIGRCRRWPLGPNSNGVKLPMVDETSRATGSRLGGVRTYWLDEAGVITESKPKFGRIELNLKKLGALVYVTSEMLDDATVLGAFVQTGYREEMAWTLDDAVINGTGVGQPLGILQSAALVSVAKETSQAAGTILFANVAKMFSRIPARSVSRAIWLINQDVLPQLMQLTIPVQNKAGSENVGGGAAYLPPGGLSQLPYGLLLGRPVVPIEQAKTIGTVGDIMLVDLGAYWYIAKDLQMASSIHVRFVYDESAFRFVYRVDGQPSWSASVTPASGSANKISPFVALATRS